MSLASWSASSSRVWRTRTLREGKQTGVRLGGFLFWAMREGYAASAGVGSRKWHEKSEWTPLSPIETVPDTLHSRAVVDRGRTAAQPLPGYRLPGLCVMGFGCMQP